MSASSEGQFDATPSRIAKAKREGNVARSHELGANVAFVCAVACVTGVTPLFAAVAREAIAASARGGAPWGASSKLLGLAMLVIAAAAAGGGAAALVQSGGLTVIAPSLKLERLSPADGIKRMISREALAHAVRAAVASSLAGGAIVASMRDVFARAAAAGSVTAVASAAWSGAQRAMIAAAAAGLAFAALEYAVARRSWLKKLKMSLHDLRREIKENDGDPLARQRRRAIHRGLIRGALTNVKDAAFVVVNPTHVAIALDYDPPAVPIPVVLVRAADEMALRVREAARDAGVPVIEDIALARALFARTDVGDAIPAEQYVAVAEIVARLVRSGILQ